MNKRTILFISLLAMFSAVYAQEATLISKEQVLLNVSENNISLRISEQSFVEARADYRQTNAIFLPNITASHTALATTNPLMAFGSKLNQEILTQSDFNPTFLNDPSQIENYATRIEIQQPIINVDGIYHRKAAKSKMKAQELQIQRNKEYLDFEVTKAYMQLQLAYKGVEVLEKALESAQATLKLTNDSFHQGYLQKADVLSVEVRVTEVMNQFHTARSNVINASDYLSFLMNDKTNRTYRPADSLMLDNRLLDQTKTIFEDRSDIKAMTLSSKAYNYLNRADKMTFLPRLNAFGSYELYDDQLFQAGSNGYTFGAQLSWNLFEGSKRLGKVQKSKAAYNKSLLELEQYKSQSQLELNLAKRKLADSKSKLKLTELALVQSEESLRIRTNRFKEGLEKTADLLQTETQYAQKQLEYYQTIFEYNSALSLVQFLTK